MLKLQRLSLLVLTVLILASSSQSAFASQSIEDLARDKQAEILAAGTESVPREKIEALWSQIKRFWDGSYLPLKFGNNKVEPSEMLRIRLSGIVYDLLERNAIKVLTPEIKAKLQLNELTCKYKGHCTELDGLYLPLNHIIFIDTSLKVDDLRRVFLHELIHAYQFLYRFPIDTATLSKLVQQGKLKSEETSIYLDYFYESQANWKGMQFDPPVPWWRKIENGDLNIRKVTNAVEFFGISTVPVYAHILGWPGALVSLGGIALQIEYGAHVTNRLLPDVAQSKTFLDKYGQLSSKTDAALLLPELAPIDDVLTKINGYAAYNFDFHHEYGAAIQKYYFGDEKFLFKNDRNDLDIYNELHNEYYNRIGLNYTLESEPACRALLLKLRDSTYSPLVTWLTLPKSEMEACSAYRGLGDNDGRAEYLDQLLNPQNQKDPFHTGLPGTEGSRPGLTILPQLRVLPVQ
jgi:hypothetical protein